MTFATVSATSIPSVGPPVRCRSLGSYGSLSRSSRRCQKSAASDRTAERRLYLLNRATRSPCDKCLVSAKTSPWGLALLQLSQYLPARVERFDCPCARAVPKATEPKRLRSPQCCGGAPRAFLHAIQWHFLTVYVVRRYSAALALLFNKDGIKASCQIASNNWTLGTSRLM